MRLLSHTAVARLVEQRVRQQGATTRGDLVRWLAELDVESSRAHRGVDVAVRAGRLQVAQHDGRALYQVAQPAERAA
jgi:hypothetical protein